MRRVLWVAFVCFLASNAQAEERWEVDGVLAFQVSGGDSQHIQLGLDGSFAFHERLRLHLAASGLSNWQTSPGPQNDVFLQGSPSSTYEAPVLLRQMLTVGLEGAPLARRVTLISKPMDLDFFLRFDAGAATSRVQLQESDSPTYGSAGVRPVLGATVGLRARLQMLVLRLSLSTISFPSKLDRVNGCTADDSKSLKGGGQVSDSCDANAFTDPRADANAAYALTKDAKARWSTLVMLGLSAGVTF